MNKTPVQITYGVFYNINYVTLYVPAGCRSAYNAATRWQDFYPIRELGKTNIDMSSNGICTFCSEYALDFSDVDGLEAYLSLRSDYHSISVLVYY